MGLPLAYKGVIHRVWGTFAHEKIIRAAHGAHPTIRESISTRCGSHVADL